MRIRNQTWIDTDTHLVILLHQPFWSAYKMFGWEEEVEGFGISEEAIDKAKELGKKIRVNLIRYGNYEITTSKAELYKQFKYTSRDKKPLVVIPRSAFKKIKKNTKDSEKKERDRAIREALAQQKYEIRGNSIVI